MARAKRVFQDTSRILTANGVEFPKNLRAEMLLRRSWDAKPGRLIQSGKSRWKPSRGAVLRENTPDALDREGYKRRVTKRKEKNDSYENVYVPEELRRQGVYYRRHERSLMLDNRRRR